MTWVRLHCIYGDHQPDDIVDVPDELLRNMPPGWYEPVEPPRAPAEAEGPQTEAAAEEAPSGRKRSRAR